LARLESTGGVAAYQFPAAQGTAFETLRSDSYNVMIRTALDASLKVKRLQCVRSKLPSTARSAYFSESQPAWD
jgi:hypothetical protein